MQFESTQYDSHELVFGVQGDGEPLVLLPGHTMSIQRWIDAGYVDRLAQNRQVIALDPLGHGRSSPCDQPDETKRFIETRNDLPSISASGVAGQKEPVAFRVPPSVDLFAYWGSDEIFHQMNVDAAGELGVEYGVVPGGHAQAFDPCDAAVALVEPFLARAMS